MNNLIKERRERIKQATKDYATPWLRVGTQPLIWINGWPAVGKQTVAQCLTQILGSDQAVLIDDTEFTDQLHLPVSVQQTGVGGPPPSRSRLRGNSWNGHAGVNGDDNSPAVVAARAGEAARAVRQAACFRKYVEDPVTLNRMVVFTDCQADDAQGEAGAQVYRQAALRAGRPFVAVYLECGIAQNMRQTQMLERRYSHTAEKICSPQAVRGIRALTDGRLYQFPETAVDEHEDANGHYQPQLRCIHVNVTDQGVHDAAMQILSFVRDVADREELIVSRRRANSLPESSEQRQRPQ